MSVFKNMTAGDCIAKHKELIEPLDDRYIVTDPQMRLIKGFENAVLKDTEPLFDEDSEAGFIGRVFFDNIAIHKVVFYADETAYQFEVTFEYTTMDEYGWDYGSPEVGYCEFLFREEWGDRPAEALFNEFRKAVFGILREEHRGMKKE